uniref:Immunoglobulin V-set domain-containing protein n=1 Tax=Seriola lalandi dorsalis TaxID=1841481 RepID=A0A3B4XLK6_SERLL
MSHVLSAGSGSSSFPVTFENQDPCAVKGSSVEFRCSYSYKDGETVRKTAWYKGKLIDGIWKRVLLSHLPSYENRTEYLGDQQHDCSLAIHDLQDNDTGYYYFRFDTDTYGWRSKNSLTLQQTATPGTGVMCPAPAPCCRWAQDRCCLSCLCGGVPHRTLPLPGQEQCGGEQLN